MRPKYDAKFEDDDLDGTIRVGIFRNEGRIGHALIRTECLEHEGTLSWEVWPAGDTLEDWLSPELYEAVYDALQSDDETTPLSLEHILAMGKRAIEAEGQLLRHILLNSGTEEG